MATDQPQLTTPSGTYTRGVTPILVNRILLVLSAIGIFVAGVLSAAHLFNLVPPCGADGGCAAVAASPASALFGVPVAYFGFITYVGLFILATVRAFRSLQHVGALVAAGYALSAIGTAFSLFLQYQSFTVIHSFCPWCFTSAVVMVLSLVGHAFLVQALESRPVTERQFPKLDSYLIMGLPILLVIAIGVEIKVMDTNMRGVQVLSGKMPKNVMDDLIPVDAHSIGPKDAALTIVEFADLQCPACQNTSPKVKAFAEQFPSKVRIVYRHFPLIQVHKWAMASAACSEYAAEKGKFWEFAMAVMGQHKETESASELYDIAASLGMDKTDLAKRVGNPQDAVYTKVDRDIKAADKIGIQVTPTFFLVADGRILGVMSSTTLFEKLQSPEVQKILNGSPPPQS